MRNRALVAKWKLGLCFFVYLWKLEKNMDFGL